MEWMHYLEVVSNDIRLAVWLSFGFLLLCLVNTMGLLLAKFSARAPKSACAVPWAPRRAPSSGSSWWRPVSSMLAGGIVGLALSAAPRSHRPPGAALSVVAQMDWTMLGLTFVLALAAATFSRRCRRRGAPAR